MTSYRKAREMLINVKKNHIVLNLFPDGKVESKVHLETGDPNHHQTFINALNQISGAMQARLDALPQENVEKINAN